MSTDALRSQVAAKWQSAFIRINRDQPGISGLLSFSKAWEIATEFVRPKDLNHEAPKAYDMDTVRAAYEVVNQSRRLPVLLETFLDQVHNKFYLVTDEVERFIGEYEETDDPQVISRLVSRLLTWYKGWMPAEELGPTIRSAYTLAFQTRVFSTLNSSFVQGFKTLCASTLPPSEPDAKGPEPDYALWEAFETLGLLDRYESIIASVGYEHIEAHVLANCTGQWAKPMLESLRTWMSDKIVPWMLLMYARGATSTEDARAMLQNVGSRFDFHMAKTLCDLRTKEIFDIIIDFPESSGALNDLKECLQRVDQRAALVQALRKANRKRLLHPGADTRLILSQYVATIKCLRIVDPPGVLLFKVADPIRRYLRERPDTIRCIVANLVGDDGGDGDSLVDGDEPVQPLQQPELEDYTDPNWEPEPIDAGPDFRANKPSDVISTLVSIYDSKDLFVKELQVLLAQRLLAITDDNNEKVEKERRNIEILKIRFGETALQVCEVMLKDMTDSKRIDGHVQSQKASTVHPTIISKHFWPLLETSDIIMPGQFQALQEQYAKEFATFKPDKKLRWLPHLGTVHLELQLEDRTVEADVPPLEAAFIELFSEKSVWKIDELIAGVGSVDRMAAVKALLTWVDMGVLKEDGEDTFRLLEVAEEPSPGRETSRAVPTAIDLPPVSSVQQQQAEQMKVHWKFIEGMLTNLGTLPLDRIQTMLRFAPGYDQSIEQLGAFMEAARREGLVTVKDGMWKLIQKT
ncbi:anaphase-promoting complex subunit 2 [Moniliophthora roreri MCA 2997]|uniref:Anaphase-promoting complex subunit 2 n=2 Tax=Moniliophthora roreri TaxID=221103 RepID=V2WZC0_MONRO|nr:anaphase-promoting complex subunit 2 [Moniliophthora roreri MCA 2997]KAI3596571.1 anaphase-promoting complex subunit 2 [Moniliophthora roreri]